MVGKASVYGRLRAMLLMWWCAQRVPSCSPRSCTFTGALSRPYLCRFVVVQQGSDSMKGSCELLHVALLQQQISEQAW